MKENLKFCLFVVAFLFFGCYPASSHSATLSAPEHAEVGRMATVTSSIKGDWLIYPPTWADLAKDSDEKTLYFVPRQDGELTIIFFGVEEGKVVVTPIAVMVGDYDPLPDPEPKPLPAPFQKLDDAARQALAESLTFTLDMIEKGRIRTVQGIRSTFKQSITSKASVCDATGCHLKPEVAEVLDAWTEETDFSTVESTKKSFQKFLKEVKE